MLRYRFILYLIVHRNALKKKTYRKWNGHFSVLNVNILCIICNFTFRIEEADLGEEEDDESDEVSLIISRPWDQAPLCYREAIPLWTESIECMRNLQQSVHHLLHVYQTLQGHFKVVNGQGQVNVACDKQFFFIQITLYFSNFILKIT